MTKTMTLSKKIVENWLLENGYSKEDIKFNKKGPPDFILSDGRKIQVKRLYSNLIYFTQKEVEELSDSTEVFIVDEKVSNPIVAIIPFSEVRKGLKKGYVIWKDRRFIISKEKAEAEIRIRCSKTTKKYFEVMLSEVKDPEDLIKILWVIYRTQPSVFASAVYTPKETA
jgi:hypothetical protein